MEWRISESERDVLGFMRFPAQHRVKLRSVNLLERLDKEVKRKSDVVGIFHDEASIIRLNVAVLLKKSDVWQLQQLYI